MCVYLDGSSGHVCIAMLSICDMCMLAVGYHCLSKQVSTVRNAQAYFGGICALFTEDPTNKELTDKLDFFVTAHLEQTNGVRQTPAGLTFLNEWGSLRHAAGAAAVLALYARMLADTDATRSREILAFAQRQVRPVGVIS